ncbi:MAG: ABC transporter substrate-binding protein, partial [Acidimicrobiia bacterium]|nr:ABC transporter substrate-binding protein [Acidimicrobiia bacterium]
MRRSKLAALALVAVFLTAACGLRAPKEDVRAAERAALGNGNAALGAGAAASSDNGTASGEGAGGTAAVGGAGGTGAAGAAGGTGAASGAGGTGGVTPGGIGVAAPAGGNGGSTDVGVTATTITAGNVSDLGGPVPGLFQGGPYGTQAYFDYVNSQGGIYGRKLVLKSVDDQL